MSKLAAFGGTAAAPPALRYGLDAAAAGLEGTAGAVSRTHCAGAIVLVASVTALRGMRGGARYGAAKHGLPGLIQALAVELAPHGIRVNAVCPTIVDTPMMNNSYLTALTDAADEPTVLRNLLIDRIEPADVACAVRWLVSDEARYLTGAALPIDAGLLLN